MGKLIKAVMICGLCFLPELLFIIYSQYNLSIPVGLANYLITPWLITVLLKNEISFNEHGRSLRTALKRPAIDCITWSEWMSTHISSLTKFEKENYKHYNILTVIPILLFYSLSTIVIVVFFYITLLGMLKLSYIMWILCYTLVLAFFWFYEVVVGKRRSRYMLQHNYGFCGVVTAMSLYVRRIANFDFNETDILKKALLEYPLSLLSVSLIVWLTVLILCRVKK